METSTFYENLGGEGESPKKEFVNDLIGKFYKVIKSGQGKLKATNTKHMNGSIVWCLATEGSRLSWPFYITLSEIDDRVTINLHSATDDRIHYVIMWSQSDDGLMRLQRINPDLTVFFIKMLEVTSDVRNHFRIIWDDLNRPM